MTACVLLAFIGSSVWVVMDRCMISAADTTQRMRAFVIAQDNMEKLLIAESVEEMIEYGVSEKFPDIRWQTAVESFYEPLGSRMWVRAVCSAEYTDAAGETKTVELTHWLTDLTNEQLQQMTERTQLQRQQLARHIIETAGLAAQYAGVDVSTIRQWVRNGMPTTADGSYLKPWLDTYLRTDGKPTVQDKQDAITEYPELAAAQGKITGVSPDSDSQGSGVTLDPGLKDKMKQLLGQ
jgi:hypothetical protein